MRYLYIGLFLVICLPAIEASEFRNGEVDALVAADTEPDGVVFEIVTWEDNSWDWAAPMLSALTRQLRNRYPDLDIALVSHGNELFDLALEQENQSKPAMQSLQNLSDDNVDIHVCGNFAKYKHLGTNDFLPFVDVSPSGPAQINDYTKLGFTRILLEAPNDAD